MQRRQSVEDFADHMEKILRLNDHKGGWQGAPCHQLYGKLIEEVMELGHALLNSNPENIRHEAVDVGNIAHMFYDNFKEVKKDV
ncbi:MAG: hypothetical protein ACOCRO_00735 [Halanaerobiales bacterium]